MLESLFIKIAGVQACSFIKKRLEHRCFPVNTAKFLKAAILKTSVNGCFSVSAHGLWSKYSKCKAFLWV